MASRKCTFIYILKYLMAVRQFMNIFVLPEVLYGSVGWNEPVIHFTTVRVVTPIDKRYFCALGSDPDQIVCGAGDSFCRT